ncbi:hypothetical protein PFISCL1PPCAC_26984, partial [Pristionchus fissidentatus]
TTASISAPSPIAHLQHMVAGGPGGTLGMSTAMPPPMQSPMNHQMMSPMMSSPAPPMPMNSQSMPYRTQMSSPHTPQSLLQSASMGGMMASPLAGGVHSMHPSTSMMGGMPPSTTTMMRMTPTTMQPTTYQQSLMGPPTTASSAMGNPMMIPKQPNGTPQPTNLQHPSLQQQQAMQQAMQQQLQQGMSPNPQLQQQLKDSMRAGQGGMGTPTPVGMQPGPAGVAQPHPMALPTPSPIEFRIHDMNRRFYSFLNTGVQEKDYAQWWDAFSHEFFDEEAKMTFVLIDQTGKPAEKYVIGRQLIPRYFRTLLDGGMNELYYVIKGQSRETATNDGLTVYECNTFMQVSKHETPYQSEVQTDATIKLEFTPFEELYNYRIKSWHIELQPSQEFSFNHVSGFVPLSLPDNIPRRPIAYGMSPATLQSLKFSVILEPMQMIMSQCKGQPQITPQDALKRICFARHHQQQQQQAMINAQNAQLMQQQPVEEPKPKATRKRQRKAPANPKGAKKGTGAAVGAITSPAPPPGGFVAPQGIPPQSMHYGGMPEVYVVGEPSMLGGEFREDERTIDKVENPNYDPNAAMRQQPLGGPGMMPPPQMQAGPAGLQQMQHHLGGPSPSQQLQQAPPPAHLLGLGGPPHGSMGPPLMAPTGGPTPPGAGSMPNGLQQPPAGEYSSPPSSALPNTNSHNQFVVPNPPPHHFYR